MSEKSLNIDFCTTDLEEIKKRARALVYTDIKVEEKYGLFVQHPYFSQVVDAIQVGDKVETVDLRKPEDLKKMRERVIKTIDSIEKYSQFFMIVRTPFLPAFFKLTYRFLDPDDYSEALADVWTFVEFPNTDINVSHKDFIKFFKMAQKDKLMDSDEYNIYKNLPEEITVYRGTGDDAKYFHGLSWTLDYEKAKWFATRWGNKGRIYKGTIRKDDILAYFLRRDESEAVIDYTKLTNVEEVS